MTSASGADLPFVDEQAVTVPAARDVVWAALEGQLVPSLRLPGGSLRARLLGTEPPGGFEPAHSDPLERLVLVGRHRFSTYRLELALDDVAPGTTRVRALTYAAFPGLRGRVYRALVIGPRAHVLATRRILWELRRLSTRTAALPDLVDRVPEGWTRVRYDGRRYGLSRTSRAGGASVALYAEELGGTDVVSANVYRTSTGDRLRACEMPDAKVLAFLEGWRPGD
jgi:hypothetical protein